MSFIHIFLFLFTIIFVLGILKTVGTPINEVNFISPFIISYLVFSYIGFPLIYSPSSRYVIEENINNINTLNFTFILSSLSIIILIFSYAFTLVISKTKKLSSNYKLEINYLKSNQLVIIFIVLIISIYFLFVYINAIPSLGIMNLFLGDSSQELGLARSNATNALDKAWRYQFLPGKMIPFLSYCLIIQNHKEKKYIIKFLMITTISVSVFYCIMNLMKGPLLFYLWSIIFLNNFLNNKKFNLKTIILFSLLALTFIVFLVWAITQSTFDSILEGVLNRIFSGSLMAGYFHVEIFPKIHDYLYGFTMPNPSHIFPFEVFELTKYVSSYIFSASSNGAVGSAPGPFWAELYANFGIPGVMLGSSLIGTIFGFFHIFFKKLKPNVYYIALFIFIAFELREISTSGFFTFFFPLKIVLIIVFSYILRFRFIKKNRKYETNFIKKR